MKLLSAFTSPFAALALAALVTTPLQAEDSPTLMTVRGKLLVDQEFEKPLPPFDGKSNGFASGFKGWRYNAVPRGGHWEVVEGTFKGTENPQLHHPATASYGFDFKNVVIQCEVRMLNTPLNGRPSHRMQVRTTDTKDYVCSVMIDEKGWGIEKDDNDHAGPDKPVPLGRINMPMKLDEWHTVLFEILGEEMVATVDGKSLSGTHSLIGEDKHSVMFVVGGEGEVRHFKVWEATPNPEWSKNKAAHVLAGMPKTAPKKK